MNIYPARADDATALAEASCKAPSYLRNLFLKERDSISLPIIGLQLQII
jgi:hypothetical protein